jgi:hypothetical protein
VLAAILRQRIRQAPRCIFTIAKYHHGYLLSKQHASIEARGGLPVPELA